MQIEMHKARRGRRAGRKPLGAITLRQLPPVLAAELLRRSRAAGLSLNRLVIELLAERLGLAGEPPAHERPTDTIDQLAGAWNRDEAAAFDRALAETRRVDDELWH